MRIERRNTWQRVGRHVHLLAFDSIKWPFKSFLEPLGRFSFYGVGLLWFYRDEISRFA
jgi:hypothetical protein